MKKTIGLLAAALLSSQAAMLFAQGPTPFTAFDENRDGVISEQEFNRVHNQQMNQRTETATPMSNPQGGPRFADIDRDGNGVVSEEELTAYRQMRRQGMGAAGVPGMDPNSCGNNMPIFLEFDLNKDGVLDKEEFIEARGQRVARRAAEGRMMRGLANMPDFESIDANSDSLISPEEFYAHQVVHCRQHRAN